ncbi:MAG: heme exporter protein CcmD [Desulfobacterales bacterium]
MKKCPECLTELPLEATVCVACRRKVGEVTAYGHAKKPFDWMAYGICLLAWAILGIYVWWAFLKQ